MGIEYGVCAMFGWKVNPDNVRNWAVRNKISAESCNCDMERDDDSENWLASSTCDPDCLSYEYQIDNLRFNFSSMEPYYGCERSNYIWTFGTSLSDTITLTEMEKLINVTKTDCYIKLKSIAHEFGSSGDPEIIIYPTAG